MAAEKAVTEPRRVRLTVLLVSSAVLACALAVALLVWKVPPLLNQEVPAGASADARLQAVTQTRTALIAGLAGLAALGGLFLNARGLVLNGRSIRVSQDMLAATRESNRTSFELGLQTQLTDRYIRAVAQLGDVEQLASRLGGIYALERLATDSERDRSTIVEVLSAYTRTSTQQARSTPEPVAEDVLAAMRVLGRLSLAGAGAHAMLQGVHLEHADLSNVPLTNADLSGAHLRGIRASRGQLQRAVLRKAELEEAHLEGACLQEAQLIAARLDGARLRGAQLEGACLREARLGGTVLDKALLHGADLTNAYGLVQAQVDAAAGDLKTRLPRNLRRPAGWA